MEKTTKKVRPKSVAVRPKKEATAARKSTFAIIFVLQKGKAREDGTAPIVARITVNHEMVHFATRMYIHPDRWLPKDYRTVGKSREEKQINDALDELRVLIRRRYDQMLRGEETITAAMLKNAITGLDQSASTLLGVCDRFIEDYTDLLRTKQCCRETYLRYLLTRNRLEEFMRNRYRMPDIPVKEIQPRFAAEFDRWLRITYQLTNNSTMKLMRQLKTMLRVGHLNGWSKNDPLGGYKIHFEKVDRGYLTDAELSRLESKVFTTRRLEVIRDLFLFSCYTGLAYIDLKNLSSDMLQRWPDGNLWIDTKRQKTNIPVHVRLLETPLRLIEKYKEPTALPRTVESEGELLPEGDCRPLRHRQGSDIPHGPPHVRHDGDAGQWCTHRDGFEDARSHEHSDNADLCPRDRHEDQQRHGGPGP